MERVYLESQCLVWGGEFWVWTFETGLLRACRNQGIYWGQVYLNIWAKTLS